MSRSRMAVVLALVLTLGIIAGTITAAASPTLTVAPAPVPQTGQRVSYFLGKGDDGELQMGIEWDAATRFTDNGDGTVLDNLTGLIWLQDHSCLAKNTWAGAFKVTLTLEHGDCGLDDGSANYDWRLPNVREMQSLIDYGEKDPALPIGHPFPPPSAPPLYWTSTSSLQNASVLAWTVNLFLGQVYWADKGDTNYVWPVRGEGITAFYQYMPLAMEDGP